MDNPLPSGTPSEYHKVHGWPCGWHLFVDAAKELFRKRSEDEMTTASGNATEHNKFIFAAPIGVPYMSCMLPSPSPTWPGASHASTCAHGL